MVKDFKQVEEELELWVDDEKERLTNEYLKKIDMIRRPRTEEDEEEEKKPKKKGAKKVTEKEEKEMVKEIERTFLLNVKAQREQYQSKYDKIKRKRARTERNAKIRKVVFGPLIWVLLILWKALKWSSLLLWKVFKAVYGFITGGIKYLLGNAYYHSRQLYTFHLKHELWPVLGPARKYIKSFFRPVKKDMEHSVENYKKLKAGIIKLIKTIIELAIKYAKKTWEIISKYLKIVGGYLGKVFKKVSAFNKKYIAPLFGWVKFIAKLFKKKEGEEE